MRPRAASLNAAATVATSAARVLHRASGDDNLCCCSARRWCATADPVYTVTTHWPRRRSGLSVHPLCVDHCASESIDRRAPLITEWNGPTCCGTVHTVVCCRIRSLPRLGLQSLHNVCETHVSLTHGRHCALHSSARLTKESLSGRAGSVGRTVERACPVGKPAKAALPFADCTLHSCCLNTILSSARVRATLGYTRHAARGVNHCERMCSVVL